MESLAVLELDSIARGIDVTDHMAKMALVEITRSHPIDPGRYLIVIRGDADSTRLSLDRGRERAGDTVVDELHLAHVHPAVPEAMHGSWIMSDLDTIGVIETSSVASIVRAADRALKAAPTSLLRLHLARRTGGKGYLVITGTQADVEASLGAGSSAAGEFGAWHDHALIPAPSAELLAELQKEWIA
ncbi:MAG: BMC domain-containing protein [Gemmatimonadetes bacterium]|nr:BMC domain-containing protein [Gemmatimonadota bacterium]